MNLLAAQQLRIDSISSIAVVDDTPVGIEAGRKAGAFTVAVSQTGNELGLALREVTELPRGELDRRLAEIESKFLAAGAQLVIRSVAELPDQFANLLPLTRTRHSVS
jgi:phosphonoacetaldehyde hydrolase